MLLALAKVRSILLLRFAPAMEGDLAGQFGEDDLALGELERQFAKHARLREYLYSAPQFKPLYGNPRFQTLLRQINLPRSPATPDGAKQ